MPQFQVETFLPQLFWLAIIFGLFYGLSKLVLVPKLQNLLATRSATIQAYLSEAEKLTDQAIELEKILISKRQNLEAELLHVYEEESHALQEQFQEKEKALIKQMSEELHKREQDLLNHEQKLRGSLKVESKNLTKLAITKFNSAEKVANV
ncbi:MAG: hypothetical protein CMM87_02270 [Rickettsiales bacterium]|nr:hypothetical protein [Rickettsiales bacterium]|tara:strand:- start:16920 stop:17372 length:453 start_codon:yes stop_codon:yes gene_type:complete